MSHQTVDAAASMASKSAVVTVQKKTFYRTEDDSQCSKWLRTLRCGCCNPKYVVNTESVKIEEWKGCSQVNDSVDVDNITDLNLTQCMSLGYCCANQGNVKLYVQEEIGGKKVERVVELRYIEKAPDVFREFSGHIQVVNNLKFGMKRPELKDMPHLVYDSTSDSGILKCWRSIVCCGCWFFPQTIITKQNITTTNWTPTCTKETLQFDLDNIDDLQLQRDIFSCCCHDAGTIVVTGNDKDQKGVKIRHVANSKKVFLKLDEYVNTLNNRNRVLGEDAMKR